MASFGDIVAVPPVRKAGLLTALPMFPSLTPGGVRWEDGRRQEADAVIWCTGFRPDLKYLDPLGLILQDGVPATTARLTTRSADVPGLYFLGYGDWCGPASATLIGVMARAAVTDANRQLCRNTGKLPADSRRDP